ncbi:hypothetical protein ACHAXR_001203, partial [Thalassiosira sp. AJA248-18]
MGRDPKRLRLAVVDTSDSSASDDDSDEDEDILVGCWSSPGYLAINMIDDENDEHEMCANLDSWMRAALALSTSIDEVSLMIQRKAASYVSSTDTLNICFNNGNSSSTESTMTNADRSILETTVFSFAAGMAKQIDSLRQTVVVEGDHPFLKSADVNVDTAASHNWASGPIGHRAGIASCLMLRLKSEIMDPMTRLQSQRDKSKSKKGDDASEIAQNPMRMFRLGVEESTRRSLPPAPWEIGGHDPEKDRAEREQEKDEFIDVYFEAKGKPDAASPDDIAAKILPPPAVMRFMDLPTPTPAATQQSLTFQPTPKNNPSVQHIPNQHFHHEEEEHIDQLHRESATLLATYQHSDLEGVQKVERSMVEITTLLSRFTDLITEQQEDIFMIHDQALKSKENVDKGQDQLVDAASRGEKSKHPMATFIA